MPAASIVTNTSFTANAVSPMRFAAKNSIWATGG